MTQLTVQTACFIIIIINFNGAKYAAHFNIVSVLRLCFSQFQQADESDVIRREKNVAVEDEYIIPPHRSDANSESSVSTATTVSDCNKCRFN